MWARFRHFPLFALKILIAQNNKKLILKKFGAGDRGRTGDVQLGKLELTRPRNGTELKKELAR